MNSNTTLNTSGIISFLHSNGALNIVVSIPHIKLKCILGAIRKAGFFFFAL